MQIIMSIPVIKNQRILQKLKYLNISVIIKKLSSIQKKGSFELGKKIFLTV